MIDIRELLLDELKTELGKLGMKAYRAKQVYSWLHRKCVDGFDEMTDLSKDDRKKLFDNFNITIVHIKDIKTSSDGTKKYLLQLSDANCVEAVLLKDRGGRKTVCVSSQVGCSLACQICATGQMGFVRDMTAGEILGQVEAVFKECNGFSNMVFMGMGEPFLNYDNVMRAIYIINSGEGLHLGARKITVSTSGIVPGIKRFQEEPVQINLAVSLNASDDQLRSALMPVNKKYPLNELLHTVKNYYEATGRRVSFEYAMIEDINDSEKDLEQLVRLIKKIHCHVNLIAFNPYPGSQFNPSPKDRLKHFQDILIKKGVPTNIRYRRGLDIEAACGQLASKK